MSPAVGTGDGMPAVARVPAGEAAPARGDGPTAPSYLRQVGAVVWKDLLVELRTRERTVSMAAFTALVALLVNFAVDRGVVAPELVATPMLWMTLIFAAMLGVGRTFHLEAEDGAFVGVLMAPMPRDALYLGKVLSNFVLVLATVFMVMGAFALFSGLGYGGRPLAMAAVLGLGALGFVALTTLFAAVSAGTRAADTLLPVLVFPLLTPMVIFGSTATLRIAAGLPLAEVAGSVRLLGAFTLTALVAGAALFRYVVED